MKYTSPYRNLSFKAKTSEVMFIAYIAIGAVPFLIYALVNYYFIKNGHISRHRLTAFIEGIRGFDVLGIIITTCISAALILLVRRMMNRMQNKVKIFRSPKRKQGKDMLQSHRVSFSSCNKQK